MLDPLPADTLAELQETLDLLALATGAEAAVLTRGRRDRETILATSAPPPATLAPGRTLDLGLRRRLCQPEPPSPPANDAAASGPDLDGLSQPVMTRAWGGVGRVAILKATPADFTDLHRRLLAQAARHVALRLDTLDPQRNAEAARLRQVLDAIPTPVIVKDAEHRWLECNEAAAALAGQPRAALRGASDEEIFGPGEASDRAHTDERRVLDLHDEVESEGPVTRPDGERRRLVARKAPLRASSGEMHLVGVLFDVTQRYAYERALARIDADVTEASGDALYDSLTRYLCKAFDVDYALIGRLTPDARAMETAKLHGAAGPLKQVRYELAGTPCAEVSGDHVCILERNVARLYPDAGLLQELDVQSYLGVPLKAADGRKLGVLAVMARRPMTNGQVLAPLLQLFATRVAAEIERQAAMAELRQAKDMAETALEDLRLQKEVLDQHAIVAMTDRAGRIIYVNDKFCEISGYSRHALLGQTHRLLKSGYHPPAFFDDLWETISSGRIWQGEIRNRAKDGSHYWLNTTIAPMFNRKGRVRGYIAVRTDITARKEAELELHSAKEKAEFANHAKSQFLAHMSHELRTPLNAVIGFTETMLKGVFGDIQPARYKDYLGDVETSARLLLEMINDVLDVSKIEAGEMTLDPEPIELLPVLRRTLRMVEQRAASKGVGLSLDTRDEPLLVHADLRHVRQILQNLLSNAVKFTGAGGVVTLRAWRHDETNVAVAVADTGVGLSEEELRAVMKPFAQARRTRQQSHEGTGLGLPLSYRLATLNGGDLWLDSTLGAGTTATVLFPRYREEESPSVELPALT